MTAFKIGDKVDVKVANEGVWWGGRIASLVFLYEYCGYAAWNIYVVPECECRKRLIFTIFERLLC